MVGSEFSPYPVAPTPAERTCIQVGTPEFAQACGSCVLYRETRACDVLAVAEISEAQTAETTRLAQEVQEAHQQRLAEQRDKVIPNFLTTQGVTARIDADPVLAEELTEGRIGVVYIDLRGLHVNNESLGDPAGDYNLQQAGLRLTSMHGDRSPGGVRLETVDNAPHLIEEVALPAEEENKTDEQASQADKAAAEEKTRRKEPKLRDIGYRGMGADELAVLIRSVTPEKLREVAGRLERLFSVKRALDDSKKGELPIVATVTFSHVEDISREYTNPLDLFWAMHELARTRHQDLKSIQYGEMWYAARTTAREHGKRLRKPEDPRRIYRDFINHCCPDYANNLEAFYGAQGIQIKERPRQRPRGGGGGPDISHKQLPTGQL